MRIWAIAYTRSRYSTTTDPRFTYDNQDLVRTLEWVCDKSGRPARLKPTSAANLSADLNLWAYMNKVTTLDFRRLGKLIDDAYIEPFNNGPRQERQNAQWLLTLADARKKLEPLRRNYNEVRSDSATVYDVAITLPNLGVATRPAL